MGIFEHGPSRQMIRAIRAFWRIAYRAFDRSMWSYVFKDSFGREETPPWRIWLCRLRGHPCGVIWYSGGYEPNMTCKNCGDNLD